MYNIPTDRYYELRYFCKQYDAWCAEYEKLQDANNDLYLGDDPTGNTAVKMARLAKRIMLIEKIAREVFSTDLFLFDAVIHGDKVDDCRYREFFWRLDQERD